MSNQTGQVNSQARNLTVTSSVFWAMKMASTATPESDAIAPPPSRARCCASSVLVPSSPLC